jgi:hypothetical protein
LKPGGQVIRGNGGMQFRRGFDLFRGERHLLLLPCAFTKLLFQQIDCGHNEKQMTVGQVSEKIEVLS